MLNGLNTVADDAKVCANLVDPFRFKCRLHNFEVGDVLILVFCIHLHARHWNITFEENRYDIF